MLDSQAGLINFYIEVVTERPIGLEQSDHCREVLVPKSYKTKSGALYKVCSTHANLFKQELLSSSQARNLQYCLEYDIGNLQEQDWILHMDEDSLLTVDSVNGSVIHPSSINGLEDWELMTTASRRSKLHLLGCWALVRAGRDRVRGG